MAEPIIITDFETGIADSPHKGIGLLRNVNIDAFTGAVKANPALASIFNTAVSATVTAADTDICTSTGMTGNANTTGQAVKFTTTGTLPAGLTANTVYFVLTESQAAGTFKVTTTIAGGTTVNITDTGSGTHTVATVNPGAINHIVQDSNTSVRFFQDSNGRVWYLASGAVLIKLLVNAVLDNAVVGSASLANSTGNGIVTFLVSDSSATYLFAFRNALIDVINVFAVTNQETPVWSNAWQTMNTAGSTSNRHHAIVAQDNIIYYTDGRFIGSVKEITGQVFAPGSSSTYTWTSQALDTSLNEVLVHLE